VGQEVTLEEDLAWAGISVQARALADGEVSSRELVATCLRRISVADDRLHAFVALRAAQARSEAEAADRARAGGDPRPLLGVPVAIKDNEDIAGLPTGMGSRSPAGPVTADGPFTARLRRAGCVIVGKTAMPELALWPFTASQAHGVTRNPWDLSRTPGGSSGGSAAAVAAGLVPFATATDGGGSLRIPAACCGLVGLKPSFGLLSMAVHWYGLSHAGVLTRTVADTALALAVLADLPAAPPGRLLVAVSSKAPMPTPVGVEQAAALALVADRLSDLGHRVVATDPPWGPGTSAAFVPRFLAGARDDLCALAEPRAAEARSRAVARLAPPAALVRAAQARGERLIAAMESFLTEHDVLLLPMLAQPAVLADRYVGVGAVRTMLGVTRWMPWAPPQNVTGQPALSLPAGRTPAGLPLAVQLVARRGRDAELLALAAQLEHVAPWAQDRPASFA